MVCVDQTQFRGTDKLKTSVRLVGDSLVRGQLTEFCGRNTETRRRYCIPGAKLDDITSAVDAVTELAKEDTVYLIHAGTNDVQSTQTQALLSKYRQVIRRYKTKSPHVIVSGILPRISAYAGFNSKASNINTSLKEICDDEGVAFTNAWYHFLERPDLFWNDGLHLNEVGSARFGRLLDEAVKSFSKSLSKNGGRGRGKGSP